MQLWHAPAGKLIEGHVLDVSRKPFERALRDYDSKLYTVWNPKKLKGWGCWEIRREPAAKTAVYKGTHEGVAFYNLEYVESRTIHHVLDAAFLNYDALRKLKQMDTWNTKDWVSALERQEEEHREQTEARAEEDLKYQIKQEKSAAHDFYSMVQSGISPAQILSSIKWGS